MIKTIATILIAFIVTVLALGKALDAVDRVLPSQDVLLGKIGWLADHRSEYDNIFIGPSYIQNNLNVLSFDDQMREAGFPLHSFSLSATHLDLFQELMVVRTLRKTRPTKLKYVFIEPSLVSWEDALNKHTERMRRLYDLHNVWDGCAYDLYSKEAFNVRMMQCGVRAELFSARVFGIGRLAAIQERIAHGKTDAMRKAWVRERGYYPYSIKKNKKARSEVKDYLDGDAAAFEAIVDKRRKYYTERKRAPAMSMEIKILAMIIEEIRRIGAEPVIVLAPGLSKYHFPIETFNADQALKGVLTIDFLNPDNYPEIYQLENFGDGNHLLPKGAKVFSRILADEFAKRLSKPGLQ